MKYSNKVEQPCCNISEYEINKYKKKYVNMGLPRYPPEEILTLCGDPV